MNKIIYIVMLALLIAAPSLSFAEGNLQKELVYRTSLGRADDVKLLLSQGASANQTNDDGVPLIALAATRKDDEGKKVLDTLLNAGANVNATDKQGQTALFYAAREGNKDAVNTLLNNKIDYYAIDSHGDVARTIAFRTGHQDITEMMDNFVKGQTTEVKKKYDDRDAEIKKQYDDQQEAARKAAEEQKNLANTMRTPTPLPIPGPTPKQIEELRTTPEFDKSMHDFAISNCAFQYWYFVQTNKQSTELTPDELDVAISSNKSDIETRSKQAVDAYKVDRRYMDNISSNVKHRIFNDLYAMPSNTYRHEQGVGKMDDMKDRCEHIANSWQEQAQALPKKKSETGGAEGKGGHGGISGIGGISGDGGKHQKGAGKGGHQKHAKSGGAGKHQGKGKHKQQAAPATNNLQNNNGNNGNFQVTPGTNGRPKLALPKY